jgi:hypothetical protein
VLAEHVEQAREAILLLGQERFCFGARAAD